jgi:hypothetical protein
MISIGAKATINGEIYTLTEYCEEPDTGLCYVKNEQRRWGFRIPNDFLPLLGFTTDELFYNAEKLNLNPKMVKALMKMEHKDKVHAWSIHQSTAKGLYKRGLITVFKGPGGTGPFIRRTKKGEKSQNGHLLR